MSVEANNPCVTEADYVRGVCSVVDLAHAMLETLNNPRNKVKPDWHQEVLETTLEKLCEEWNELVVEIECLSAGADPLSSYRAIMREAVDLANVVMMVWDKARNEVEHLEARLENEFTRKGVSCGL